jgi:3-hydroxyacyl-CoA dehydrogenase
MAKGKMTAEAMAGTLALISPTTSYDGFDQADIVVEAVFESMDLKKATFAELASVARPDAILASNTSTLDIDELAAATGRPAQVIGHPSSSPASDSSRSSRGRDQQGNQLRPELAKQLSKVRVVVARFGFVANHAHATCAGISCSKGATLASRQGPHGFRLPVGPFGIRTFGIDVVAHRQHLKSLEDRAEGPQSAVPIVFTTWAATAEDWRRMVSSGQAGRV